MELHILKIKPEYFSEVLRGFKSFELRKNDRDYQVGDLIHFINTNGDEYTLYERNTLVFKITYVLKDVEEYGLDKDYCILGIKRLQEE